MIKKLIDYLQKFICSHKFESCKPAIGAISVGTCDRKTYIYTSEGFKECEYRISGRYPAMTKEQMNYFSENRFLCKKCGKEIIKDD